MQTSGATTALITAGILLLAIAVPASAGSAVGKAAGAVTWDGESGDSPGRTSVFKVEDGAPGEDTSVGDSGIYHLESEGVGTLTLDVTCVKVESDWAEFAGVITSATGRYTVGEVFLVSVKDSGKGGTRGDEIGMKGKRDLDHGCTAALNDTQFGRKGIITGGNIKVRPPR